MVLCGRKSRYCFNTLVRCHLIFFRSRRYIILFYLIFFFSYFFSFLFLTTRIILYYYIICVDLYLYYTHCTAVYRVCPAASDTHCISTLRTARIQLDILLLHFYRHVMVILPGYVRFLHQQI